MSSLRPFLNSSLFSFYYTSFSRCWNSLSFLLFSLRTVESFILCIRPLLGLSLPLTLIKSVLIDLSFSPPFIWCTSFLFLITRRLFPSLLNSCETNFFFLWPLDSHWVSSVTASSFPFVRDLLFSRFSYYLYCQTLQGPSPRSTTPLNSYLWPSRVIGVLLD